MIQRVAMINSNNTQLNSDYDFTKLWKWLLGNQGGIEEQSMFSFDLASKTLSAGTTIANAYILCTRPTSAPIQNQTFLAHFEFTGELEFLDARDGDKIFIEINEELITDPTKIEDLDPLTEYAKGLGIGAIKVSQEYPTHSNYLKLWKIEGGQLIDERRLLDLPKIQEIQAQLDEQKNKVSTITEQVGELQKAGLTGKLTEQIYPLGEAVYKNDILFVERMPTADEATDELKVGADEASKIVAIPLIASGEEGTSITLPIKKIGNPSTHLVMELRTDDNGQPSQQLYHANAKISLAPTEITTNKTTITANFQGSFPAPTQGQRLRLVISQQDQVVNSTNYYSLYMAPTSTTTRPYSLLQEGQWVSQTFKTINHTHTISGRHMRTLQDTHYHGTRFTITSNLAILKSISKISTCTATSVRVRKGSTVLGTYQFQGGTATITPPLQLEKSIEYTLETYNNGNSYTSIGRDSLNSGTLILLTGGVENLIPVGHIMNIQSINIDYQQMLPSFVSLSSSLCINHVLSKASAGTTYTLPLDLVRIAQQSGSIGEIIPVSYYGQHSGMNGLQGGQKYYLSNMPGLISTIGEYEIGVAINETTLYTTGLSGKLYQYSSKITTVKQSHTHPLIRHAKKVVIVYDGYEYERMRHNTMTVSYSRGSTATDLSTATLNWNNDTIDFITTHTLHNGSNISFTFYV